ncbi:methionyl-tRNA formyltransferase [Georgenia satyanarayanai]|uniref:Methionyl-tRNA formyltransferase n=1 Tax=Georgenia satyanarayanai TaxID=860221 RepID=A0A2Y9A0W1_9MICO|nr:methionyl-tRNA formyltransferase [Georgenia satyanarayanai]PYG02307.1 methionyl-tRNA formyltransferase [Georgenia satyanarayanai]SSA37168.1 methionyl-tRNA formyltransferase [Georgenia satyanarayanai]
MRLLFAGTPEVALPSLRALAESEHEVVAVLTRPDARRGRGRTLHPSPVAAWAREQGIPVLTPRTLRDAEAQEEIAALGVDAAPVVAYGALIPPALLDVPRHGWVNLHFSLLPAWRGAAPVQHAVIAGDDVTGATTFRIEEGLDTGPVLGTLTETVRPTDTAGDLLARLAGSGAPLLLATLDALESGSAVPVPQPADGVSHAPRLEVTDARVEWAAPAVAVDRLVRGTTPAPGPWTTAPDGSRLKLGPVQVRADVDDLAPGALHAAKAEVLVGTGNGAVELGQVAPAGRSWMAAADWARGARLPEEARLGGEAA